MTCRRRSSVSIESTAAGAVSAATAKCIVFCDSEAGTIGFWAGERMARILIVDDDSDVRRMLRFVLQRSGHEIDEAEDGAEGLRKAVASAYDAAVVDYQMPPPDGLELLGQLRDLQ